MSYAELHLRLRKQHCDSFYVTEYRVYLEHVRKFLDGSILNSVAIGPPGVGKTYPFQTACNADPETIRYVCSRLTAAGLYRWAYQNRNLALALDDIDGLLQDRLSVSQLKALMDRNKPSTLCWQTQNTVFEEAGVPLSFRTTSRCCILLNDAPSFRNKDVTALFDRSRTVVFDPTPAEVHGYVGGFFSDKYGLQAMVVYDFIGSNLQRAKRLSCRHYDMAVEGMKAGFDWRANLLDLWSKPEDPESGKLAIVEQILKDEKLMTNQQQAEEWKRQTGHERNSWQRWKRRYKEVYGSTIINDRWDDIGPPTEDDAAEEQPEAEGPTP